MDNNKALAIGLKENILQFSLLVVLNLFVGSMVGLERTILPIIGEETFGLVSTSAALSFIVSFGFSKAIMNFFAGTISDKIGRKKVLLYGWIIGLFVPVLVIFAQAWWVIIVANILLGVNQGMAWSMTVNMKVDLVKDKERGLAVGLNEFAGYSGVALTAMVSGYLATTFSLRPEPFYLGIAIALVGILLSLIVKDTDAHLKLQSKSYKGKKDHHLSTKAVFKKTLWKDKNLFSSSFAGLSTNLKDGMAWGLFPLFFSSVGLSVSQIGIIVAIYPAAWGFFQLFTGPMSDRFGRKWMITLGMWLQALSIWWILLVEGYTLWLIGAVLLGVGTAMVYPTLIASISDVAHPDWRASSLGIYRSLRDAGYAFGAIMAGVLTDFLNVNWAMGLVALIPFLAGLIAASKLEETVQPSKI
ncbi:MFS transporter [Pseudalkalibacillus sp. R45]|uniref:MFS transporter n=1 Tax=Pseudalkalibacillus sp. R45 TaxID=3457433 RepID=UPI003FCCBADB